MGSLADMLDMAQTGAADVVYVPMSSFADRLPLSGVAELPGFFGTATRGTEAFQALLDSDLAAAEFEPNGVMPLMGALLPPYQIASAGDAITADADWDGLRLRTPGGILEIAANAVGATAVPMGGPDMYAAMQRGTVDATVNAFASLNSYKLNELLKAVSSNASFDSFAFTIVIKSDVFAGLAPEIQTAMTEAGDATAMHVAEWMDANEQTIAQKFADESIEIYEIYAAVLEGWNTVLGEVATTWAGRLDERGLEGTATLDSWKAAITATK
jgi:TRAP-type C4-dicarboxylate transport system substrate-binding protein